MGLTLTSIVSLDQPAHREYSFTDHTNARPNAPPPGDRIDAELDRIYRALRDVQASLTQVFAPDGTIARHSITTDMLDPETLQDIKTACTPDVQRVLVQVQAAAGNALFQADQALKEASRSRQAAIEAGAKVVELDGVLDEVHQATGDVGAWSTEAEREAIDAQNSANDAAESAIQAGRHEDLAGAWAEYMEGGNPIPSRFFAHTEVTGDHWSSRWWANRAAGAFGKLSELYLGVWPEPPTTTSTGDPIPTGAIYYNSTTQQPYVWDGNQWQAFAAPTKALVHTFLYRATAGQTSVKLTDPDLGLNSFTITAADPEPLEVFLNGVRIPRDSPNPGNGDWNLDPATSTISFLTPLLAGTMVQIDVLAPVSSVAPSRVQTQALLDFDIDPATGNPGQIDGVRTTFPIRLNDTAHTPVTVNNPVELFISLDGVIQQPGADFSISGSTITFSDPPIAGARAWGAWYGPGVSGSSGGGPVSGDYLPLTGGVLTGPLTLAGLPTLSLQAATKSYVDGNFLATAGGTLTGPLTLAADPTAAMQPATKAYADTKLSASGGTLTGPITLAADPTTAMQPATKQYVDSHGSSPATAAPLMDGAAQVGTALLYAREDHRHPTDTTRLALSGGTLTGPLALAADPSTPTQAATKSYVDARVGVSSVNTRTGAVVLTAADITGLGFITSTTSDARYVDTAGDTMTGALILPADPTTALQAATKQYVDAHTSGGGVVTVATVAALRAGTTASLGTGPVLVQTYRAANDGGGGIYLIGANATDNGGTILNDASGRSWYRQQYGQPISALTFGAVPDGTTVNTTALQAWLNSGTDLYLPVGRFLTGALTLSNVALGLTEAPIKITGAGCHLQTASGRPGGSYLILNQPNSTLLTLTGCQYVTRDITFLANGALRSLTGAIGVQLNGGTGNSLFHNCAIIGFAGGGFKDVGGTGGTTGSQISSCFFLYNGGTQLYMDQSNDFMIYNCQIGMDAPSNNTYGVQLNNCGGGTVLSNFIWGNGLGFYATGSHYLRVIGNRFEQSNQQGSYITNCNCLSFIGNWSHDNGQQSVGAYDNAYFQSVSTGTIDGNTSYNWGGAAQHRYGFFFDSGCSKIRIGRGNVDTYAAQGPIFIANPTTALSDSVLSNSRVYTSGVGLSSGAYTANVLTLTLSAGVWELSAIMAFNPSSSLSQIYGSIDGPGLSGPATGSVTNLYVSISGAGNSPSLTVGPCTCVTTGASTTVGLGAQAVFSGSCTAYGSLRARRIA